MWLNYYFFKEIKKHTNWNIYGQIFIQYNWYQGNANLHWIGELLDLASLIQTPRLKISFSFWSWSWTAFGHKHLRVQTVQQEHKEQLQVTANSQSHGRGGAPAEYSTKNVHRNICKQSSIPLAFCRWNISFKPFLYQVTFLVLLSRRLNKLYYNICYQSIYYPTVLSH